MLWEWLHFSPTLFNGTYSWVRINRIAAWGSDPIGLGTGSTSVPPMLKAWRCHKAALPPAGSPWESLTTGPLPLGGSYTSQLAVSDPAASVALIPGGAGGRNWGGGVKVGLAVTFAARFYLPCLTCPCLCTSKMASVEARRLIACLVSIPAWLHLLLQAHRQHRIGLPNLFESMGEGNADEFASWFQ